MALHERAGMPALPEDLTNIPRLLTAYYARRPDSARAEEGVSFGTSGHRGSSLLTTFNERHIMAISQALCEVRQAEGIRGPLFVGFDTHALSEAALVTSLEVFGANGVTVRLQEGMGYTPTPALSHAILTWNAGRSEGFADGVVITPSHNPPADGGFKYNSPSGGPADTALTARIQDRANELLRQDLRGVRSVPYVEALAADTTQPHDFCRAYVDDLAQVLDMDAIARSGLKLGVDPMGGAGVHYWEPIAETYGLDITVVNTRVDPTFGFMTLDSDGRIRMDCSSPYAMKGLIKLSGQFDVAFGNDPDADRHGIVTRSAGLLNPNHYLAVAAWYLFRHRPHWRTDAAVAKTVVSSSMIDRVAAAMSRLLVEVPVGFKWFVEGLSDGSYGFAGEESAGASFLRKDGRVWTTDKDGITLALLAAEIMAKTGRDPGECYAEMVSRHGNPVYERTDTPASPEEKMALKELSPTMVQARMLAGEPITQKLTHAPGNGAAIGGLKVSTESGWFAARPSGTENVYKIYAESFKGADHLAVIQEEARAIVGAAFRQAGLTGREDGSAY